MDRRELERLDDEGIAAWSEHDPDRFVDQLADDFMITDVSLPQAITTKDGARAYVQGWITAFPDMNLKQLNRLIDGDMVAGEVEFTGTNTGPMMMAGKEIPPTNKSVVGRGVYFAKVSGGKVVEFKAYPDIAGMMMQLGFMPEM